MVGFIGVDFLSFNNHHFAVVASQGSQGDVQRSIVDRLIWELVQLCAPQNDNPIKLMAGECLGELGAVDPYAIAFSFPQEAAAATASLTEERLSNDHQMIAAKAPSQ